jgi:hypothetical protein
MQQVHSRENMLFVPGSDMKPTELPPFVRMSVRLISDTLSDIVLPVLLYENTNHVCTTLGPQYRCLHNGAQDVSTKAYGNRATNSKLPSGAGGKGGGVFSSDVNLPFVQGVG